MLLIDLFLLRDTPFRHAAQSPRAPLWVGVNLAVVGILYGLMRGVVAQSAGGDIGGIPIAEVPATVLFGGKIVSGVVIVVVVHVGITLFAWLGAKGVGGPGLIIGLYRMTAYALPLGVPALPLIAARADPERLAAAVSEPPFAVLYLPLAAAGGALFLVGLYHIYALTQGQGPLRTGAAVTIFTVLTATVVYLA